MPKLRPHHLLVEMNGRLHNEETALLPPLLPLHVLLFGDFFASINCLKRVKSNDRIHVDEDYSKTETNVIPSNFTLLSLRE